MGIHPEKLATTQPEANMRWKPEQLANNRTTTNQQKNQHSHGPEGKNNISMKKKQTTSRAEERHRFYPSPPQQGVVMTEKSKQTLGLVASSFPFLFLCPDSLFTFPRTTTKNIENSVDPR